MNRAKRWFGKPSAMNPPKAAHLQGPLWHVAGQRWLPQRSFLLQTSSQGGQLPSQQRRLHTAQHSLMRHQLTEPETLIMTIAATPLCTSD
jgi:hypothetical protein